jgi:peptidoglycan/xylan/chitin deacetylase (PgdA/CDA1 family)
MYYGGLSSVLSRMQRQPRILMLHGVGTQESPASALRAQLTFLKRNFRIVALEQIWECDSSGKNALPKLALTFDDGLRNNFNSAYPILKEFDAPATFYVCPALIEARRWLWNHECRARLGTLPPDGRLQFGESLGISSSETEEIIKKMKGTPSARRREAEEELRKGTPNFVPTPRQSQQFDIMSWDELKALDKVLITIGSHSTSHEILPQLDSNELEREIGDCKAWLERELCRPVHHFCYPDGAYNDQVLSCVGRHFTSAVTTKPGWVSSQPSLLELPRIATPLRVPDLAWEVHRPTN